MLHARSASATYIHPQNLASCVYANEGVYQSLGHPLGGDMSTLKDGCLPPSKIDGLNYK